MSPVHELTQSDPITILNIGTATATTTSSGVDLQGYVGEVQAVLAVGTVSGTSPTLDGKIQDSADNSVFADVSGLTFPQITASNPTPKKLDIQVNAVRRFIRFVGTIGGTTPSFNLGVQMHGFKAYKP